MSQLKPANEYLIGGGTGGVKPPPGLTYLLFFMQGFYKACYEPFGS